IVDHLNGRQSDAGLRPEAREDDLLLTGLRYWRSDLGGVPGVHGRALDRLLAWKNGFELRPHIAAVGLGFHRRQDNRNVENPSRLGEGYRVVDDRLPVEIRSCEQHLRLMVDERHYAVVGSEQTFFATFHMCL